MNFETSLELANQYAKRKLGDDWFVDKRPDWPAYGLLRSTGGNTAYLEFESQSMEAIIAHIDMLYLSEKL